MENNIQYVIAPIINQVDYELAGYFDTETNTIIFGLFDVVLGGRYWQVGRPHARRIEADYYPCACGYVLWQKGLKFPKGYTTIYCPNCGKEHTVANVEK